MGWSVAGAGDGRCRWREKTSQVCVFGPNCDANRHCGQNSVAGQPFFADLRHFAKSPATPSTATCDILLSHLRRTTFPRGAHAATTTATPVASAEAKATAAASPTPYNFSATLESQGAPSCFTAPSHQRVGRMLCQNTMAVAPVATR